MAGAAGGAMIFFMLLIGSVIVGLYAGAYAAHLFLVTIDGTAAGYDEVTWPDEPYFDWLWKLFYLGWLVTLWLVPLLFYAKLQMRAHTAPVALMHVVVAAVVIAWLVFPITMLSSMGGPSRWFVLYPPALRRIAARSGSMVYFYILSGPVLAAGGLSAALLFFYGPMPFVAIGAAGSAVVLILYARLFGRLALALQAVVIPGEVKRQGRTRYRHSPQVQAAARDPITQGGRARFVQPEDMPPTNAPDPDARVGYNVRLDNDPAPEERPAEERRRRPVDLEEGHYGLADPVPEGSVLPRGPLPEEWSRPKQYELELAGGGKRPVRPEHPWASGIFGFPFRPRNVRAVGWLALLFVMFGILVRLAAMSVPG